MLKRLLLIFLTLIILCSFSGCYKNGDNINADIGSSSSEEKVSSEENVSRDTSTDTSSQQEKPEEKPCNCDCHAGGIKAFFFKLINFFAKIFDKNARVCDCGKAH